MIDVPTSPIASPALGAWLDRHAQRSPGRIALAALAEAAPLAALPLDELFATAVTICAPFRTGTRFGVIPDARFFLGQSQLRAPGALLPAAADRTFARYLARVDRRCGAGGFQLAIAHPQVADFALWSALRSLVQGVCAHQGVPALPIACELLIGRWTGAPQPGVVRRHQAALTVVLSGALRHGPQPLAAGELGYVPPVADGAPGPVDAARAPAVALRLWLPARGIRLTDALKDVVARMVDAQLDDRGTVHYLPFPPAYRPATGHHADAAPLARAARALDRVARSAALRQAARITWARRVSACGLEPPPPPRAPVALRDDDRVTAVTAPVRLPIGRGLAVWAVHGHAMAVADEPAARRVLRALAGPDPKRVADVVAASGPASRDLLAELIRLRAVDVVAPARRARRAR